MYGALLGTNQVANSLSPPRLDRFWVVTASCLIAKKMFGDPFGPLSPPSMAIMSPLCPRYAAQAGPEKMGSLVLISAPTGSWEGPSPFGACSSPHMAPGAPIQVPIAVPAGP